MVAVASSIFGRIVTGHDVEQWVMRTLQLWFSTYLSDVERQHGVPAGTLARPRSWVVGPSFDKWPEDQLPAIVVVSIGLADAAKKSGDGSYRARWDILAGSVCSARTEQESRLASMFYVAALRALLTQKASLDGLVEGTVWLDEDYTLLQFSDERSLAAGAGRFEVEVYDVTTTKAGPPTADPPLDPDTQPWPAWPVVTTVEETVIKVTDPITQP